MVKGGENQNPMYRWSRMWQLTEPSDSELGELYAETDRPQCMGVGDSEQAQVWHQVCFLYY